VAPTDPTSEEAIVHLRTALRARPIRRIAVLCREHLGDLVNSSGAIAALRQAFPGGHLIVEAGERTLETLALVPGIDETWSRPTRQGLLGKAAFVRRLARANCDLVVILDDSNPMILHAWLARVPIRVGVWRGRKHAALFTAAVRYRTDYCETRDNFRALLGLLGVNWDGAPALFPSDSDRAAAAAVLGSDTRPVIGLQPGASLAAKRWPVERFAQVADAIATSGRRPLLIGSPNEAGLVAEVASRCAIAPESACGRVGVGGLAALCARMAALVTNDTGPMHLAAAMGTRVVALFGPTDAVAYAPWGTGHALLCGRCPCPVRSPATCRGECLRAIGVEEVLEALG
jgi:ADP-heptose:LPS heptosyltransferase